jgi:hypothetical protein
VIREYCHGLGEYFVTFEDLSLSSLWTPLHSPSDERSWLDGVSIVVDWDRDTLDPDRGEPDRSHVTDTGDEPHEDDDLKEGEFEETLVTKSNGVNGHAEIAPLEGETATVAPQTTAENGDTHHGEEEPPMRSCELCQQANQLVQLCPKCKSHSYHPHCMPLSKLDLDLPADSWRCWHCICESTLSSCLHLSSLFPTH